MRIYRIRKFPTKLVIFIILLVLIPLFNKSIPRNLKHFTVELLSGPLKALFAGTAYFKNHKYLSGENLELKQEIGALTVQLLRLKEISNENERLKKLLKFKDGLRYDTIGARVISRDSTDWRGAFFLDKGKKDGIKERMPCTTIKGFIGNVVETEASTSKVMLITDPNSRIGAMLDPSRESGILTGSPLGTCRLIYLSLDAKVEKGDKVVTAGYSAFSIKGLPIGEVAKTGVDSANLYKYAIVKPYENLSRIEEVLCIAVSANR